MNENLIDCPCCMHESGEGSVMDNCNLCKDSRAIPLEVWKSWVIDSVYGPWPEKIKRN